MRENACGTNFSFPSVTDYVGFIIVAFAGFDCLHWAAGLLSSHRFAVAAMREFDRPGDLDFQCKKPTFAAAKVG